MNVTVYIHMTFQHVKSGPDILRIFLHSKERLDERVTLIGSYCQEPAPFQGAGLLMYVSEPHS